jgi:hypothetical protein
MRRPVRPITLFTGVLLVLAVGCGGGGNPAPGASTAGPASTSHSASTAAVKYAHVVAYFTEAGGSTVVHFKTVDTATQLRVADAIAADPYDQDAEGGEVSATAGRVAMLVGLRAAMSALGWTEVGVGEQWYDVQFSGGPDARVAVIEPDTSTSAGPPSPTSSETLTTTTPTNAPEPTPPANTMPDYEAVLGEPIESQVLTDFVDRHGCFARNAYYKCYDAGIEMSVSTGMVLASVFMYANRSDYAVYQGELPMGLRWGMSRASVEAALGRPDRQTAPTKYSYDPYTDVYLVTGHRYKTLTLEFSVGQNTADTELLGAVTVSDR